MTVVGIDVSKGKSMVAAMKPGGELVAAPYEVTESCLSASLSQPLPQSCPAAP